MADYFTPTVIQELIPDADLTPLERLLLPRIFQSETHADGWYFFAEIRPEEIVGASRVDLELALTSSPDTESSLHRCVTEQIARADADTAEVTLDFTGISWETFFQDIVKRSKTLRYITVIASFTCSKMRSDGFGGMAVLITRDTVRGKSTNEILAELLAESGLGEASRE